MISRGTFYTRRPTTQTTRELMLQHNRMNHETKFFVSFSRAQKKNNKKKRDRKKRSHRLHIYIYVLRAGRDLISIMKTKGTRTLLVMCVWTWTIIQNVTSIKFLYWKTPRKTKQMNHPKRRQKYKIGRRRRTNKTCRYCSYQFVI